MVGARCEGLVSCVQEPELHSKGRGRTRLCSRRECCQLAGGWMERTGGTSSLGVLHSSLLPQTPWPARSLALLAPTGRMSKGQARDGWDRRVAGGAELKVWASWKGLGTSLQGRALLVPPHISGRDQPWRGEAGQGGSCALPAPSSRGQPQCADGRAPLPRLG